MSTPAKEGQTSPAFKPHPTPDIYYMYPEEFPVPECGFYYGQILYCLLDRANSILQYLINDFEAGDTELHIMNAAYVIDGLLTQGKTLAEQLKGVEQGISGRKNEVIS